jgi:hypothetical protein
MSRNARWARPPDPAEFRLDIPGPLWRAWESGEITRVDFWEELEAQLGGPVVRKILGLPDEGSVPRLTIP